MKRVIQHIQRELKKRADVDYKKAQQWFFKEGIRLLGVRVGVVRKIGAAAYRDIDLKEKDHVFKLAEELLSIDLQETRIIGLQWVLKIEREYLPTDFRVFERWLKTYVSNWAVCDGLAKGPLGMLFVRFPELIRRTRPWRRSRNRWVRRAAAVSLIKPVRAKQNLKDVFEAANALLTDPDDMVQKGYGWMLKEASCVYPREVFQYIMKHKDTMPRTALRYAIEKFPKHRRQKAMKR